MEYEVGKYYNVRCAKMTSIYDDKIFYFVPIIGEAHKDIQFGFPDTHYHIDGRFVGKDTHDRLTFYSGGLTNQVCSLKPTVSQYFVSEIVIKIRKCKRLTTGLFPPSRSKYGKSNSYYKWADTMTGKSCKGKRCPHLGTQMLVRDGKLFCPLHNLIGCIEKEIILKQ